MNKIHFDKIVITEYNELYKLKYLNRNFQLLGITLLIDNIQFKKDNYIFHLVIKDDRTVHKLQHIDNYLASQIQNYKSFLVYSNKYSYISFDRNEYIESLYKKNKNKVIITIKYIKKNKSNTPIIHINE